MFNHKNLRPEKISLILLSVLAIAGLVLLGCEGRVAGGVSETENTSGISGVIVDESNEPVKGARAFLIPGDFIPTVDNQELLDTAITDSLGLYTFQGLSKGSYNIAGEHTSNETKLFVADIPVYEGQQKPLAASMLRPTGSLLLNLASLNISEEGTVYIPGTRITAKINSTHLDAGSINLEDLPQGNYKALHFTAEADEAGDAVYEEPLRVSSDSTSLIGPYSTWATQTKIIINTTPSGADISEDVLQFPLCVRLTGVYYDFTRSQPSGEDIRFSKSNGDPLEFEIERFDPETRLAEIWVKIDTVYGNNNTQHIYLYSGQQTAGTQSSGSSVFDTDNQFQAVWHLHEENPGLGAAHGFTDATSHAHHGSDRVSAEGKEGVLGPGQEFDGIDDFISTDKYITEFSDKDFTVSAWIKVRSEGATLLSQTNNDSLWTRTEQVFYLGPGSPDSSTGLNPSFVRFNGGYALSDSPLELHQWYYIVMAWDADIEQVIHYVNGVLMNNVTLQETYRNTSDIDLTNTVNIGILIEKSYVVPFDGFMDELRISGTVRSAGWIKLSYENQKVNSTMLEFSF